MGEDRTPAQQGEQTLLEITPQDALTSATRRIHCPDTNAAENIDELDQITIHHFLSTIADIALSVARRRLDHKQGQNKVAE